jgi:hypothetical protein
MSKNIIIHNGVFDYQIIINGEEVDKRSLAHLLAEQMNVKILETGDGKNNWKENKNVCD